MYSPSRYHTTLPRALHQWEPAERDHTAQLTCKEDDCSTNTLPYDPPPPPPHKPTPPPHTPIPSPHSTHTHTHTHPPTHHPVCTLMTHSQNPDKMPTLATLVAPLTLNNRLQKWAQ